VIEDSKQITREVNVTQMKGSKTLAYKASSDIYSALRFHHISEENRGLLIDWLV
jgi:hypothetical protein